MAKGVDRFSLMMIEHAVRLLMKQNKQEIEQAIANVKQTAADKVLTRQFFRSEARKRWSDERWRRYIKWRREQEEGQGNSFCEGWEDRWWRKGPGGELQRRGGRSWRRKVRL